MSKLRRYYEVGNTYFVTCVTYNRHPFLFNNEHLLRTAIDYAQTYYPFNLSAWVIMPDHFHLVAKPEGNDLSKIMKVMKMKFAGTYRSHVQMRGGRIWQNRFWDHIIRSQDDMNRHLDYIHYNPVKHKIISSPREYPYSSFREYLGDRIYPSDWGSTEPEWQESTFGE